MKILLKISIIIFLLLPVFIFAKEEVVINEIAWMGQKDSYSHEWIELYNATDEEINLKNWKLQISKTEIPLKGTLEANSYYLMERSSDDTVNNQKADLIFKKAFNNKGETIILINEQGQEIDKIDCSQGWFSGNNKTKQTMERINPLSNGNDKTNWQNSENENGTPKEKNSIGTKKEEVKSESSSISDANADNSVIAKKENTNNQLPVSAQTYCVASMIAIFSAGSVLAIKKSYNKQ
ncbi:MAG: lamin tail domain-containing protein [Candidatus Pacebacteria bacterium]|nr:lamin tail domain-containing protein [Candidatus Paceibacterota bacterium]